jgi:hypothetical protein
MIFNIIVKKNVKVRVWIDESPDAYYPAVDLIEYALTTRLSETQSKTVVLEMAVITGPRKLYGLLGATYIPERTEALSIHIAVSDSSQKVIDWSLVGMIDQVRLGLPEEFADAVLKGAIEATPNKLGAGMLRFDCAAHGMIGSSPYLFGELSKIVVTLLRIPSELLTEDEIAKHIRI